MPGSALKVREEGDSVMYAVTTLKGQYQAGYVIDGAFTPGMILSISTLLVGAGSIAVCQICLMKS